MEETKFLNKTKIIILCALVVIVGLIFIINKTHKSKLIKEYKNYEKQLEYSAPNYLQKEKISLKEYEWRKIDVKEILKQGFVSNKRASDCEGYVLAQGLESTEEKNSETLEKETSKDEETKVEEAKDEKEKEDSPKVTNNITYKAYITCKKLYTTVGYGEKPNSGKENNETTQTEKDTEKPVIKLFGDETINLQVGDKYEELGAMATDNIDNDVTDKIKITGEVNTSLAGTYTITYTVRDTAGNKATISRKVIVKEKQKEEKKETTPSVPSTSQTPSTTTPTTPTTPQTPSTQTTPSVPSTPSVPKDTTSPIITFNDDSLYQTICVGNSVNISANGPYGFVARDNVDGIITSRVSISGSTGIINAPGVYNIYYEVSDSSGNKTTATKQFTAKDCSSSVPQTTTTISVTSVTLTPNDLTLIVGQTFDLRVTVYPDNATNKSVTYSSTNPSVATVSSTGIVTALKKGTTTITATSNNNRKGISRITVQ